MYICYLCLADSEIHDKDAKVSGWGVSKFTQLDKIYPCKLKEATLKVKIFEKFDKS